MNDSQRIDFLDAINRQANSHGAPARGWTIHIRDGVLSLSDDGPRRRPLREVLDEYFEVCHSPIWIAPQKPTFTPAEWQSVLEATRHLDAEHRCASSVFCPRCASREDVRALALEHEERRVLGHVDVTEADISPGEK